MTRERCGNALRGCSALLARPAKCQPETCGYSCTSGKSTRRNWKFQNEAIREFEPDLTGARVRYANLFDNSPVAYLIVNLETVMLQAKLSAAAMLATQRESRVSSKLTRGILPQDQDVWYLRRTSWCSY